MKRNRDVGIWIMAIVAIAFGILTLKSGGEVLFIDGVGRANAGNFVPFVLWSNFLLGFIYLIAGIGIWLKSRWSFKLSISIAAITLVVFIALGVYILLGGEYESRTVAAMVLRTSVWSAISYFTYQKILS